MKDKSLISLDKFILMLLKEEDETTITQINDKLIIFLSSIWYQQWDTKNKSLFVSIFDNFSRVNYYLRNLFNRRPDVPIVNGFFDTEGRCNLLTNKKLIEHNNEKYKLTKEGLSVANGLKEEISRKTGMINNQFFQITSAERNNTIINFILAIVKLTGGFLSGSAGLKSDGLDATSDTISAFFVYLGIKSNHEKFSNILVVVMLFVAGLSALYESGSKLYAVFLGTVEPMTHVGLIIAIESISIFVSLFLFTYQRHLGKYQNNLTLISQSVDSKNHILVALVVIVGALANLINIHWLDAIIGLFIAFQILHDSIDLAKEVNEVYKVGGTDYSKYKTFFGNYMNLNHHELFYLWIIYSGIHKENTKEDLINSFSEVLNTDYLPILSELGINQAKNMDYNGMFDEIIQSLMDNKLIVYENSKFKTSNKGINYFNRFLSSYKNYDINVLDLFILKLSDE